MFKRIFTWIIHQYQRFVSPLFPPSCRYYPTCSNYALQAIQRFGAFRGSLMAAARILRCNPFVKGGYDPVPDHFSLHRNEGWKNDPNENFFYNEEHLNK